MTIHIALYAWKEDVTSQEIAVALDAVRQLKDKVEGLVDIKCGENFSKWNEGFTHAIVVLAEDQAALDRYRNHPDHFAVAKQIDHMESKSIGVDFVD